MSITNEAVYNKIKNELFKRYPKPSAYRSGLLVQAYKEEMSKRGQPAYHGKKKEKEGLSRWFSERWLSDDGSIGYKHKNSVYRPTRRINEKTPTTFSELSKEELEKAKRQKYLKGRVTKFKQT